MRIVIETIPHDQHRYPTIGDWWTDADGTLQIRASEFPLVVARGALMTANHRIVERIASKYAFLIALHETIEAVLCEDRGITALDVDAWDGIHLDGDEPGELPDAPYHKEHVFAESIERLVAQQLGVNWQEYERACLALDGKS